MGFSLTAGNNMFINLEPDSRSETERLFAALAAGGTVETPLQEMFWGGYFGTLVDRFGIGWMFNCASKT
jgi:PhnB protein